MAAQQQLLPESTNASASRSTSCQLPVQSTGAGRSSHRPSHSCDLESAKAHPSGCPKVPRAACYTGAKSDKDKPGYSPHAAITLLSVFVTLIPVAFIAGYSTALLTGGARDCSGLSLAASLKGGGNGGRQLSYDQREDGQLEPYVAGADAGSEAGMILPALQTAPTLPGEHMIFVTWIAFGDLGDSGFHIHNFHEVDMRWAEIARKSHPGCKIGLVMDQDTQLQDPGSVDFLHRITIDKKVYGRNEYNDFYHWTARYSFLEKLQAEGEQHYNVVFLDPDVFVLDDVSEAFDHGRFDYMVTISENPVQPINGAMHFVRAHHYGAAIDLLKGVLASFHLEPEYGFTAGQQAYADFFELTEKQDVVDALQAESVEQGAACRKVQGGEFTVCYVICTIFNHWEACSTQPAMAVQPDRWEDYEAVGVKVLHFVAYRKLGMTEVYNAFMAEGRQGAYRAWAALPHDEDGFKALIGERFSAQA